MQTNNQNNFFMLNRKTIRTSILKPLPGLQLLNQNTNAPEYQPKMLTPVAPNASKKIMFPPTPKMKWGEHVWFMIHTLTVLVKEDVFPTIQAELIGHLYSICTNLPCPICSDHAKTYLKSINFKSIQTKEQMKNLFHQFHNFVNTQKNYPLFPREQLETKYQTAILPNILVNFQLAFQDKSFNPRHISDQHIRKRVLNSFTEWMYKHIQDFQ